MIKLHERDLRGRTDTGWLDSAHSFSFGGFHDPARMGFGPLRVINEDRVVPGAGFPAHSHSNMDIITIVLSGALGHKDSLGNGSVIKPGDIQRMFAGSGITHSEMNASDSDPVHFLQIWIEPQHGGNEPASYEQISVKDADVQGQFGVIAAPLAKQSDCTGAVGLHSDSYIRLARVDEGSTLPFPNENGRQYWLQLMSGAVKIDGEKLAAGDALQIGKPADLSITASAPSELLLFDLAA